MVGRGRSPNRGSQPAKAQRCVTLSVLRALPVACSRLGHVSQCVLRVRWVGKECIMTDKATETERTQKPE